MEDNVQIKQFPAPGLNPDDGTMKKEGGGRKEFVSQNFSFFTIEV